MVNVTFDLQSRFGQISCSGLPYGPKWRSQSRVSYNKHVKIVLRNTAGGYLFTSPSHNSNDFLLILIESKVFYLGKNAKLHITHQIYHMQFEFNLMFKTVAQSAITVIPACIPVKLECKMSQNLGENFKKCCYFIR